MRDNIERAITFIFSREGARITNDKFDHGGLTAKYGLTLRTMRSLKLDLDHDGDVDAQDVLLVDKMVAEAAFKKHFWNVIHGDDLPGGVDLIMADIAWNAGPGRANQFYREGHKTAESLTTRRKQHYLNIIERDPTQERYRNGWMGRATAALLEAGKCITKS